MFVIDPKEKLLFVLGCVCPYCKKIHKPEEMMEQVFKTNNVNFKD